MQRALVCAAALLALLAGQTWAFDAALVYCDEVNTMTPLKNALEADPDIGTVTLINACSSDAQPTLDDLLVYEALFVHSGSAWSDGVAMGDVLYDYLDAGGALVADMNTLYDSGLWGLQGEVRDYGYLSLSYHDTLTASSTLGSTISHPILAGVSSITTDIVGQTTLDVTATQVAAWSNGYTLAAVKYGVVSINLFFAGDHFHPDADDSDILAGNALVWAWDQIDPAEVYTVAPNRGANDSAKTIEITGYNIFANAQIRLIGPDKAEIPCENPQYVDWMTMRCSVELDGAAIGEYDIEVENGHGLASLDESFNVIEAGDKPCQSSWRIAGNSPHALFEGTAGAFDGKVYLTSGICLTCPQTMYVNSMLIYDLAADTWSSGAVYDPIGEDFSCGGVYDGKFYMFGGIEHGTTTRIYDPADGSWTTGTDMPSGVIGCFAAPIDGVFYVSNGVTDTPEIYGYDVANDTWIVDLETPPEMQAGGSAVTDGDKLYALGGMDYDDYILKTLNVYDPAADTWDTLDQMSTARFMPGGAYVNGHIYAISGGGFLGIPILPLNSSEIYSVAEDDWSAFAPSPEPTAEAAMAYLPEDGGTFVLVGGYSDDMSPYECKKTQVLPLCLAGLESIDPSSAGNGADAAVEIAGVGFEVSDIAYLTNAAKARIDLIDIVVVDSHVISAVVPAGSAAGVYDLVVQSASGESDILEDGFEIIETPPGDDDDDDDDDAVDDDDDDDDSGCCG